MGFKNRIYDNESDIKTSQAEKDLTAQVIADLKTKLRLLGDPGSGQSIVAKKKNSGTPAPVPDPNPFGVDNGLPIAGDFDGDGQDDVGVYNKQVWHLDTGFEDFNNKKIELGRNSTNTGAFLKLDNDITLWTIGLNGTVPLNGFLLTGGFKFATGSNKTSAGNISQNGLFFDSTGINANPTPITNANAITVKQDVNSYDASVEAITDITGFLRELGIVTNGGTNGLVVLGGIGFNFEALRQDHDYTMTLSGNNNANVFAFRNRVETNSNYYGPSASIAFRKPVSDRLQFLANFNFSAGVLDADVDLTQSGPAITQGTASKSKSFFAIKTGAGAGLSYLVNPGVKLRVKGSAEINTNRPQFNPATAGSVEIKGRTSVGLGLTGGLEVSTDWIAKALGAY